MTVPAYSALAAYLEPPLRRVRDEWDELERDARADVRAQLEEIESMPLVPGSFTAWVDRRNRKTDRLSVVHRIGAPVGDTAMTVCGEVVPAAILRMPLNPNLIRTLGKCRYCENLYAKRGGAT